VAQQEGHEVHVFLTDDGVVYGRQGMADNVVCPTGDEMANWMEMLTVNKVPIYV
jgi:sulfur relay (sulfurtransferase) complex TusBCD TusD component (DsrE family)